MVEKMAQRLKQLMNSESLSYEKFGEIAGVSAQAVMKWLKGGEVKEANVEKIARHYKVTPMWIRYGDIAAGSAGEPRAAYGGKALPDIALDIASRWVALSAERQESFRDMLFTTHWMEQRFPVMRKGRPKGERYEAWETAIEKEVRQLKLKL
jgi:transcriptional regulator with XRE-family HTH domain